MYTRGLALPDHSFFLFGPRGTGKTTWLRQVLGNARWYDLLHTDVFLRLLRHPETFRQEVSALPPGSWIVLDEVQKLPHLLNDVHALLFEHRGRLKFALCGSSARKLRRLDTNLLAGRVINRRLLPLSMAERGPGADPAQLMRMGGLPAVHAEPKFAVDILEAYVATYIKEEVQHEALVKEIGSFSRFLDVAALLNAQVLSTAGVARDAGVARPTVQRYFDILADTFLGSLLPAWRPQMRVREIAHPKFYLFDCGVARALTGRLRDPLGPDEKGPLFETLVHHELRAWMALRNAGGTLSYWRTPSGVEVDFIWTRGKRAFAIEAKSATRWRPGDSLGLVQLRQAGLVQHGYGVYGGDTALRDGEIEIFPIAEFVRRLHAFELP